MIGIIIQARMGSTRLPGKVLMKLGRKTILEHILYRMSLLQRDDCQVVVATSLNKENDAIEKMCTSLGVSCFRGSENNVLKRYYDCMKKYQFEHVVRLTADNPFVDIQELNRLIDYHCENDFDFSYSDTELPEGIGAEIFSEKALEKCMKYATLEKHFEHIDEYVLDHLREFKSGKLELNNNIIHPEVSFTIDTEEQFNRMCLIQKRMSSDHADVLELLEIEREVRG